MNNRIPSLNRRDHEHDQLMSRSGSNNKISLMSFPGWDEDFALNAEISIFKDDGNRGIT